MSTTILLRGQVARFDGQTPYLAAGYSDAPPAPGMPSFQPCAYELLEVVEVSDDAHVYVDEVGVHVERGPDRFGGWRERSFFPHWRVVEVAESSSKDAQVPGDESEPRRSVA